MTAVLDRRPDVNPEHGPAATRPQSALPVHQRPAAATTPQPALPEPLTRGWRLHDELPEIGAYSWTPGYLRALIAMTLAQWHLASLRENTELVLTELVTNAVQAAADPTDPAGLPALDGHGRVSTIRASLRSDGRNLLIEVRDKVPGMPAMKTPEPDDENGRGLLIIRAVCMEHGCHRLGSGEKISWALIGSREPAVQATASTFTGNFLDGPGSGHDTVPGSSQHPLGSCVRRSGWKGQA